MTVLILFTVFNSLSGRVNKPISILIHLPKFRILRNLRFWVERFKKQESQWSLFIIFSTDNNCAWIRILTFWVYWSHLGLLVISGHPIVMVPWYWWAMAFKRKFYHSDKIPFVIYKFDIFHLHDTRKIENLVLHMHFENWKSPDFHDSFQGYCGKIKLP